MAADDTIVAEHSAAIPAGYTVPTSQMIAPKAVTAVIDGTSASGTYLPVLEIVSDGGVVVARCPVASSLAAGASAEVSWFPRGVAATSSGGTGIQFDTDNEGGWLDVTSNATDANGFGIALNDTSGGGVTVNATGSGDTIIGNTTTAGYTLVESSSRGPDPGNGIRYGIQIDEGGNHGLLLLSDLRIDLNPSGVNGDSGDVNVGSGAGNVSLFGGLSSAVLDSTGTMTVKLGASGDTLTVENSGATVVALVVHQNGQVAMPSLPTSSAGLAAGSLWNNANVVNIV